MKRRAALNRYAAFLRGVSPTNAKMPELKKAFESAGFAEVRTVLSSGNVVFVAAAGPEAELERQAETAMQARLGKAFPAIVREVAALQRLLASDPFTELQLERDAKRVVTFLRREPKERLDLPIARDGASILRVEGREVFSAYVPSPLGPVFMTLIEKTFGRDVTTRTWDTLAKVVKAGALLRQP